MGFLSRSNAAKQRNNNDQHEQLAELRRRARRRLVGALVIVLLVVVLVPILLKSDGAEEIEQVVQVFPPIVSPSTDSANTFDEQLQASVNQGTVTTESSQAIDEGSTHDPDQAAGQIEGAGSTHEGRSSDAPNVREPLPDIAIQTEAQQAAQQAQQAQAAEPSTNKQQAASSSSSTPSSSARSEPERTDDGSLALAVLEGRVPVESQPSSSNSSTAARGGFIVQVAAYSSRKGADERQQQLHRAGVNNAFVQAGEGGSGTTYRLRVGPFENRQAAEAALTRLRSLGYDDSFISAQ